MDCKYNMLKHPNIAFTANGKAKPYEHGITENAIASVSFNYSDIENVLGFQSSSHISATFSMMAHSIRFLWSSQPVSYTPVMLPVVWYALAAHPPLQ